MFDFVFCLGILYHLKHPLLALEIVCALTTDTAIVESFVTDAEHLEGTPGRRSHHGVLRDRRIGKPARQLDWSQRQLPDGYVPGRRVSRGWNSCTLPAFTRESCAIGSGSRFRRRLRGAPPELLTVTNSRTFGVNFSTRKEEYVTCWFRTPERLGARAINCGSKWPTSGSRRSM